MFKHKLAFGLVGCALFGFGGGLAWPEPTRLTFISVGQGDCAVFQTGGTTILVDAGPKTDKINAGERIVIPKLRQLGVDGVDLILLSHPDMDHIGGVGPILHAYPSARVAASYCFRENRQLLEQLATAGRRAEDVIWLNSALEGRVGTFDLRVICPVIEPDEESNDGSMFLRISSGSASAVFSGDAPSKSEMAVDRFGDWSSEILKAGHHGSKTASSEDWLEHVHPSVAILSCGLNNPYGHPHKIVLDRLSQDRIETHRTDLEGDLSFIVRDGKFVRE